MKDLINPNYYFSSSFKREVVGSTTTQYIFIGGDAYSAKAMAKKVGTGAWTIYNIFRDHLGTITHLKDATTGIVTEYSFDAWGRRRDANDWTTTLTNEPALFADRGFTGHEYLEDFKLYNMNGRLYDPAVGRFLSADPVVKDPGNSQSYNRYSYCLNNPLKYTDPSGYTLMEQMSPQDLEGMKAAGHGWETSFNNGTHVLNGSDSGIAKSFNPPGQGENGPGLNGTYYDWYSGTYRSTASDNSEVGWNFASNIASQFGVSMAYAGIDVISSQYVSYKIGANGAMTGVQFSYTPTNAQLIYFQIGGKTYSTINRLGNAFNRTATPEYSNIGISSEDIMTAIGISADGINTPISITKSVLGESGKALQSFTRTGTVIGAIAGGIPAAIHMYNNGFNWNDTIGIGLAAGGVAVEFFGVGEVWDAIAVPLTIGTISYDIYNVVQKY